MKLLLSLAALAFIAAPAGAQYTRDRHDSTSCTSRDQQDRSGCRDHRDANRYASSSRERSYGDRGLGARSAYSDGSSYGHQSYRHNRYDRNNGLSRRHHRQDRRHDDYNAR
jgi:Ni/Co efflux regulator RcnB